MVPRSTTANPPAADSRLTAAFFKGGNFSSERLPVLSAFTPFLKGVVSRFAASGGICGG